MSFLIGSQKMKTNVFLQKKILDYIKLSLIGAITIGIAYLTICLFSPTSVAASKTIIVHYPAHQVKSGLADLSAWKDWHPYLDSAEEQSIAVSGNTLNWTSKNGTQGKVEITHLTDSNRLSFSTSFLKNDSWKTYQGEFLIEGNERESKLSWIYVGEPFPFYKRPANYVIKEVILHSMDVGLQRYKKSLRDRVE